MADLSVSIAGIRFQNPVFTAAGTFGFAREFEGLADLSKLGAIIPKTITYEPREGNPPPRIVETPAGMLNSIGLQNPGLHGFLNHELPYLQKIGVPIIVNIAGATADEYATLADALSRFEAIAGLEVNVSCPNVAEGGMIFGLKPGTTAAVVNAVRRHWDRLLIVKLSPNVADIVEIAKAAVMEGADAITAINTVVGMAVDWRRRRPRLANVTGGLSGPAIKPIALRMVWQIAQKVRCPVIGAGGIASAEDALEFIVAGATAVEVGTANFRDPQICGRIVDRMHALLNEAGVSMVTQLVGTLQA